MYVMQSSECAANAATCTNVDFVCVVLLNTRNSLLPPNQRLKRKYIVAAAHPRSILTVCQLYNFNLSLSACVSVIIANKYAPSGNADKSD